MTVTITKSVVSKSLIRIKTRKHAFAPRSSLHLRTITPRNVAINTQKIALNALAFLYNQFLQQPLGDLDFTFATKPRRLPEVLSTRGCSYSARIGRHIQPAGCHYITLNPDTL